MSFWSDITRISPRPLFLAPMEDITDVPFRRIARKHGAHVTVTPMIHCEALLRRLDSPKVKLACTLEPGEGLQLCGADPHAMAEAARHVQALGAAFVDINMGCPAPNVVKRGEGAALLKDPQRAAGIVRAVVKAVAIPVTVKMRAGWDDQYRTAAEIAKAAESEGAQAVAIHARTRAQRFRGQADWGLIREIKSKLSIPVIGNGDVFKAQDAQRMFAETGCDAVMVGRGALGNPWIFSGSSPAREEIRDTLLDHMEHHLSFYSHPHALLTFRKHMAWYTKGLHGSAQLRKELFAERSLPAVVDLLRRFLGSAVLER